MQLPVQGWKRTGAVEKLALERRTGLYNLRASPPPLPRCALLLTLTPPSSSCTDTVSRVVPAKGDTRAASCPASRLSRLLFPALGGPTIAMRTPLLEEGGRKGQAAVAHARTTCRRCRHLSRPDTLTQSSNDELANVGQRHRASRQIFGQFVLT